MSDTRLTFIIAHSNLAKALLSSVEKILGKQDNTFIYSNEHDSMVILADKIDAQIKASHAENIVCFTDLKGGSCWNLASMLNRKYKEITVISGVNLPMLTTYFNNRHKMAFGELIDKTVADGCRGITKL